MPAVRAASTIRLVYILAASHSGSTLLAMLLGSHPQVCSVGELKGTSLGDPDRYRCSCGAKIRGCRFWRDVARSMALQGFQFDVGDAGTHLPTNAGWPARRLLRPLHRGAALERVRDAALAVTPGWRQHLSRFHAANTALASTLLKQTNKTILVDSSKIGLRLKYLLRNPCFDLKVIRLVRDGRAVALTYMDPERFADAIDPNLRGGGDGSDRAAERLPMARAAREWQRSNEEAEALLRHLNRSQSVDVRYEQLCAQPAETRRSLFEFLGVDPEAAPAQFRAAAHHVLGNGMRFDRSSDIRLDDRWRQMLSAADLAVFDRVAGQMNRRLGYI